MIKDREQEYTTMSSRICLCWFVSCTSLITPFAIIEAERTNAAIGEALATGRPAEPPADPFHGLTASQMENMTLKEVEEHCFRER